MNENGEELLTSAQKRAVIKRTLKAVNEADKGHLHRETIGSLIELSSDIIMIILSAIAIDGISQSKPLGKLTVYAAAAVGVQAVLSVIRSLLLRRQESHTFRRTTFLSKSAEAASIPSSSFELQKRAPEVPKP